jgi:mgtE-like transporter
LLRPWRAVGARFRALLRSETVGLRQGFVALLISSGGDLLAGLTLASIDHTLKTLAGLVILIPAAIGMRGNIFGALGSRLGTSIHTGTFRLSRRLDTVVGQNLAASTLLSIALSVALAVLAKSVAIAFGQKSISVADFVVISVVGGILSSAVVMVLTVMVAAGGVSRGWDMDNVAAPIVTAAGDVVTLPSLYLATFIVRLHGVTTVVSILCAIAGVVALVVGARSNLPILRRVVRESMPVLILAGVLDVTAGVAIDKRLDVIFAHKFPGLLILIPPFLEDAGALGGILSSRLSSKLHLGLIEARRFPAQRVGEDVLLIYLYAIPVFTLVALSSYAVATAARHGTPGAATMIGASLLAGFIATTFACIVAYYGAVATYRLGLDPDNHGIPIVTSTLDLLGVFSFILALVIFGVI